MDNTWPNYQSDPVGHCVFALEHGNEDERFNAADILRGLGRDAESAIPALIAAMQNDEDVQVRAQCAFALSGLGAVLKDKAAPAVPALTQTLLHDPDSETRALAAGALGNIGTAAKEALPALRQALRDSDEDVRENAQKALDRLEDSPN